MLRALKGITIVIIIAFILLLLILKYLENSFCPLFPCSKEISYSKSEKIVDLYSTSLVNRLHLRIPKAYLSYRKQHQGGEHESIYLEALLPDLRPKTHFLKRNPFLPEIKNIGSIPQTTKETIKDNRVYITINNGLNYGSSRIWQGYLKEYKKVARVTEDLYLFHKPNSKMWDWIAPLKQDTRNTIYFNCSVLCEARTDSQKHVSLKYMFHRKHLKYWAEIDKQVKKFVNNFVVSVIPINNYER